MADSGSPDSEPTTRTLLRRVLDTADPRTPRRPRSARRSTQRVAWESPSSRRPGSSGAQVAVRRSQRVKSVGRLAHVQASGQLEDQTPRTLLKNILLTAPESSAVVPESEPAPAPKSGQASQRESSSGSLELQFQELEPPAFPAVGPLALGRRKQKLRLSVFQKEVEQDLPPSYEPLGNVGASSLTSSSSLNLTFATPRQPQSVQRPGLARKPPTHRAVDVTAFLQDIQKTSLAFAPPDDNLRTPVATVPTDVLLEDTQPFSQPLVGPSSRVHSSTPCPSHNGSQDVERRVRYRTPCSSSGLNQSPRKPSQLVAESGAKAVDSSNTSSNVSAEDGSMPLQHGCHKGEGRIEESLSMSRVKGTVTQIPAGMEEAEGHTEPEPAGPSGTADISGRRASPESASDVPEFLEARQLHPPPSTAVLSSEPQKFLPATRTPKARIPTSRSRQDPYKRGLNHYMKFFSFYAKMPLETKSLEVVEKCLDKYFQHLCDDLEAYAAHAGRKTVGLKDLELLMRRQGLVTNQISLHVLVERHLPLEYRELLIPCAFSGNSVFPAQ